MEEPVSTGTRTVIGARARGLAVGGTWGGASTQATGQREWARALQADSFGRIAGGVRMAIYVFGSIWDLHGSKSNLLYQTPQDAIGSFEILTDLGKRIPCTLLRSTGIQKDLSWESFLDLFGPEQIRLDHVDSHWGPTFGTGQLCSERLQSCIRIPVKCKVCTK